MLVIFIASHIFTILALHRKILVTSIFTSQGKIYQQSSEREAISKGGAILQPLAHASFPFCVKNCTG